MSLTEHARVLKLGPGSVIANRFEIVERVGAGGMGIVYKGVDRSLNNQVVALKILNPFLSQNEVILKRFMNEVLVARSLSHPNIIRIHDIGNTEDGFAYISMEFVNGRSLNDIIMPQGEDLVGIGIALNFDDALSYLFQILNGVAYAHEKGIIHRDLKPANVMISKDGEVKLADFGTARVLGEQTGLTQDGQTVGTPDYMSPEQIRGEVVDCRSDLYSFGIIAYQLVTGRRPFIADSPVAVAFKHISDPFPFFANEEMGIPKWFERIVHKATAKRKEDRYASAEMLAFALAEQVPELSPYSQSSHVGLPTFSNIETMGNLSATSTRRFTVGAKKTSAWVMNAPAGVAEEEPSDSSPTPTSKDVPWLGLSLGMVVAVCIGIAIFFFTRRQPSDHQAGAEEKNQSSARPIVVSDIRDALERELLKKGNETSPETPVEVAKKDIQPTPEPITISEESVEPKKEIEVASVVQPETPKKVEEPKPTPLVTVTPKPKVEKPIEPKPIREPEPTPSVDEDMQSRFGKINKVGKDSVNVPDVINVKPPTSNKTKGEVNLLGAHTELYRGSLIIEGSAKQMSLELIVHGDRVTGLADIVGYDTFDVSGGIYPRGVSFTLKNSETVLNLTGTKRNTLLRGTFTTQGSNKIGKWEVSAAN